MNFFKIHHILFTVLGYPLSYVEFFGTLFGLASVWLAAKQNINTWSTGILNVICFFSIFYQVQLYSDMFLQIYFFVTSIYGWFIWKRQKQNNLPISILSIKHRCFLILLIVALVVVLGFFIKNIHLIFPKIFIHPAAFPFLDTFIAVSSVFATILLAKRMIENWILWIIVDFMCIFLYAKKQILFISLEYAIFFILANFGLFLWIKSLKNDKRIGVR